MLLNHSQTIPPTQSLEYHENGPWCQKGWGPAALQDNRRENHAMTRAQLCSAPDWIRTIVNDPHYSCVFTPSKVGVNFKQQTCVFSHRFIFSGGKVR